MELIDKEKVIEEIERIKKEECPTDYYEGRLKMFWFEQFLSFVNTLEVKRVDLEKEFDNYTKNILACDVKFEPFTHLYNCAKHFYELGLNAKGG